MDNLNAMIVAKPFAPAGTSKITGQQLIVKTRQLSVAKKLRISNVSNVTRHSLRKTASSSILILHISSLRATVARHAGKAFFDKGYLKDHKETVHLKIRRHVCKECDKSFGLEVNLKGHIKRVHLRLRPHSCTHCSKSFATRGDLKTHERVNHKEE